MCWLVQVNDVLTSRLVVHGSVVGYVGVTTCWLVPVSVPVVCTPYRNCVDLFKSLY